MLGFGVMIPVVRDLTLSLVSVSALSWPAPEVYMGILMASYSGAQMLSSPVLGRLSDIYGRKPIFLFSAIGNVGSYVIWVLANNYWLFLAGRLLSGGTGGNIAIAQSIIADHTTPDQRPRAMGLLGAAIGMGFVLGPFLGGAMISINQNVAPIMTNINPFWTIGAGCLILAILSVVLIIVSQYEKSGRGAAFEEPVSSIFAVFSVKPARIVLSAHLLSQVSFVSFEVLFAWILQRQYHMDLKETYYFFGLQGVLLALVQGGIYRRIEKRRTPEFWVGISLLGSAVGMVILPWIGYAEGQLLGYPLKILLLIALLAVMALALGFGGPSINAYASIHAPKNEQGQMMGHMQAMAAFARFAVPVLATTVYAVWLPLPFLIGGAICLAAWLVFQQRNLGT